MYIEIEYLLYFKYPVLDFMMKINSPVPYRTIAYSRNLHISIKNMAVSVDLRVFRIIAI